MVLVLLHSTTFVVMDDGRRERPTVLSCGNLPYTCYGITLFLSKDDNSHTYIRCNIPACAILGCRPRGMALCGFAYRKRRLEIPLDHRLAGIVDDGGLSLAIVTVVVHFCPYGYCLLSYPRERLYVDVAVACSHCNLGHVATKVEPPSAMGGRDHHDSFGGMAFCDPEL